MFSKGKLLIGVKYALVVFVVAAWYPLQYLFVGHGIKSGADIKFPLDVWVEAFVRFGFASIAAGFLIAVMLLGLAAISSRWGKDLSPNLGRRFVLFTPPIVAIPISLYVFWANFRHDSYSDGFITWGMDLLLIVVYDLNQVAAQSHYEIVVIFAAYVVVLTVMIYAILLISDSFARALRGRP